MDESARRPAGHHRNPSRGQCRHGRLWPCLGVRQHQRGSSGHRRHLLGIGGPVPHRSRPRRLRADRGTGQPGGAPVGPGPGVDDLARLPRRSPLPLPSLLFPPRPEARCPGPGADSRHQQARRRSSPLHRPLRGRRRRLCQLRAHSEGKAPGQSSDRRRVGGHRIAGDHLERPAGDRRLRGRQRPGPSTGRPLCRHRRPAEDRPRSR